MTVQLLEIYNEAIRDLLVPEGEARQQRSLPLVNTQRRWGGWAAGALGRSEAGVVGCVPQS